MIQIEVVDCLALQINKIDFFGALSQHDGHGQALLDIWEAMPEDPVNDRAILDRWAENLASPTGMNGCHTPRPTGHEHTVVFNCSGGV